MCHRYSPELLAELVERVEGLGRQVRTLPIDRESDDYVPLRRRGCDRSTASHDHDREDRQPHRPIVSARAHRSSKRRAYEYVAIAPTASVTEDERASSCR